ncbi:hypothetical protein AMTR_s00015p00185040, partial [Amborella trichopoda]
TSGPNGTADTEEGISKPDSALRSSSEIAGAEATRVVMSVLGTSPTVSTSIGVDIVGGGVETAQASTFTPLIEGATGDAPVADEPLLFEQMLFFKTIGGDGGPHDPLLLSPTCLFSSDFRGILLGPVLAGLL